MRGLRLWHDVSNGNNSETRNIHSFAFYDMSQRPSAATTTHPRANKEVLDLYIGMKLARENLGDLDHGLGLFRFVPGPINHDRQTHVHNDLSDLVTADDANPNLAEVQPLASTKVFIPSDHYELTTALQRCSIALDVYLGPEHALYNCLMARGKLEAMCVVCWCCDIGFRFFFSAAAFPSY
jgi:hypothetical protein